MKAGLDGIPKAKAKYRTTASTYKTSYFLNCYFDEVATLEPVAKKLEGENLWRVAVEGNDQKLTPGCLVKSAQTVCP